MPVYYGETPLGLKALRCVKLNQFSWNRNPKATCTLKPVDVDIILKFADDRCFALVGSAESV